VPIPSARQFNRPLSCSAEFSSTMFSDFRINREVSELITLCEEWQVVCDFVYGRSKRLMIPKGKKRQKCGQDHKSFRQNGDSARTRSPHASSVIPALRPLGTLLPVSPSPRHAARYREMWAKVEYKRFLG
jgi:hypothetical protein